MRKLLIQCLFAAAVLFCSSLTLFTALAVAGPPAEVIPQNGDVNCDGSIELTDAVHTLRWLFQGGVEPCSFEDSPELIARIAELESLLEEKEAALTVSETALETCRADLQATRTQLIESLSTLQATAMELETCSEDLESVRTERDNLQDEVEATTATLIATQGALGSCVDEVAEANVRLADCSRDLGRAETAATACEADLSACDVRLGNMELALADAEARLAALDSEGCTDPRADNFDSCAVIDDGSCEYLGCTDPLAGNYDPAATVDDGSCEYLPPCSEPPTDYFSAFSANAVFGISDGLPDGRSGMSYRGDDDTLYFVSDDMGGRQIRITDAYGNRIRDLILPPGAGDGEFDDTEGIAWLGNGAQPSNTFAILDEGDGVNPVRIHVLEITSEQTTISSTDVTTFVCGAIPIDSSTPDAHNLGAEGIAYDPLSDVLYVAGQSTQANEGGLWRVDLNDLDPNSGEPAQTLLWHFYDKLVDIPGGLSNNHRSRIGDLAFRRVEGCETLLVLTRGDDAVTDNAVWHLNMEGEIFGKFEHGLIDSNALGANQRKFESLSIRHVGGELYVSTEGGESFNADPKKNNLWVFSSRHYIVPRACESP